MDEKFEFEGLIEVRPGSMEGCWALPIAALRFSPSVNMGLFQYSNRRCHVTLDFMAPEQDKKEGPFAMMLPEWIACGDPLPMQEKVV